MGDELLQTYSNYYARLGHTLVDRYPLVHPAFRTSFVLSAGVIEMKERLSGTLDGPSRCLLIQPCFRHFDIDRVKSGLHLSLFLMGAALYFDNPSRTSVLEAMIRFVIDELDIGPERLWLTAFAGGSIGGNLFESDGESQTAWLSLNMPKSRLVLYGPDRNFWREGAGSGQEKSGLCGPHAELFFDRGRTGICRSSLCSPGCDCGRFLEIGNAVFPQYRLTREGVSPIPQMIAEGAMGLDRLAMALESAITVFDTRALQSLKNEVLNGPMANAPKPALVITVLDHVRSFCCLVAEGALPGRKGRGHILRKMLKKSWEAAEIISTQPHAVIRQVADSVFRHPEATAGIDVVSNWPRVNEILERELSLITSRRTKVASP